MLYRPSTPTNRPDTDQSLACTSAPGGRRRLSACAYRSAAWLTMHKCVAGWHASELQSESTLHADPTARPEAFGICLSLRLLPREPQLEFASQLTLGGG